jgi:hypothetical protein
LSEEAFPPAHAAEAVRQPISGSAELETDTQLEQCQQAIDATLAEPGLPGAPDFDKRRLELFTRAKAEPVVMTETPQLRDEEEPSAWIRGYRELLSKTNHPWDALKPMLPKFKARPQMGRAVLLRDGYLYADEPLMAQAIVGLVGAEHLFGHDHIWVQRGENTYHASRKKGHYYFTDGPSEGEEVRLLLLDRVGHGDPPERSLIRDFRSLRYRLLFDRASVRHLTESHVVADLEYGTTTVPTLLSADGAHLELQCQASSKETLARVEETRRERKRREAVVSVLRHTMQLQIADQLPFDEPRREWGFQLDGKLRGNWEYAYSEGRSSYAFNGDRYFVFNKHGGVLIPEVCVDFLTDTFERASGTWYAPKGKPPQRFVGGLDYNPMDLLERAKLRRIPGFLAHARANPDKFDVMDVPVGQRIPLGRRFEFTDYLRVHQDDYRAGDIVMIRGKVPWDPSEMHYHSFFIYESDPITGTPIALVGNAGRPTVRYWETEAKRTPKREIWHRIRPTTQWLESIISHDHGPIHTPPPISPRGNAG